LIPKPALPDLERGPEALFAINRFEAGELLVVGEMPVPEDGFAPLGIGVLVDDVLGYAIVTARPPDTWSVSTEISIDFVEPLTASSGVLRGEGRLVHSDSSGGFAIGTVRDEAGTVIAHCRQRGRFVPIADDVNPYRGAIESAVPAATSSELTEILGLSAAGEDRLSIEVVAGLRNPLGNLHGGIALALSGWLAGKRGADRSHLPVSSIHVNYVRPIPGGSKVEFFADRAHRGQSLTVTRVMSYTGPGKPRTIATVTHG
jgi:acyl-coenzyme A thioesterase PaaI-like protein